MNGKWVVSAGVQGAPAQEPCFLQCRKLRPAHILRFEPAMLKFGVVPSTLNPRPLNQSRARLCTTALSLSQQRWRCGCFAGQQGLPLRGLRASRRGLLVGVCCATLTALTMCDGVSCLPC